MSSWEVVHCFIEMVIVYLIWQVLSLDLSSNKLRNLDGFKDLGQQASNLKHLKICNNQVKETGRCCNNNKVRTKTQKFAAWR